MTGVEIVERADAVKTATAVVLLLVALLSTAWAAQSGRRTYDLRAQGQFRDDLRELTAAFRQVRYPTVPSTARASGAPPSADIRCPTYSMCALMLAMSVSALRFSHASAATTHLSSMYLHDRHRSVLSLERPIPEVAIERHAWALAALCSRRPWLRPPCGRRRSC